jgi:hypothetical protein
MDQVANLIISGSHSVLALYAMNNVQVVSLVLRVSCEKGI